MEIIEYLKSQLERKSPINAPVELYHYYYLDEGHIDSLGVMKFVAEIEQHFNIEIDDDEMISDEFRTLGGLATIIERKIKR